MRLWRDAGLKVAPGAFLGRAGHDGRNPGENFIRVALVADEPEIEDGLGRLARTLGQG